MLRTRGKRRHSLKGCACVRCAALQVAYPDGRQTLCLLPNKFNKKLWVKRGGYLLIEEGSAVNAGADAPAETASQSQASTGKVTGTIVAVLYDDHIRQLKKFPGVW